MIDRASLSNISATSNATLYRAAFPVDKIKEDTILPQQVKKKIEDDLRSYVGSLNWLSISARPDLSTISDMLSRYLHKAKGRRALVVRCFPRTHRKVTGSNNSVFAIHEFSFGLLVRILPSAFSLPAFMYSAKQVQVV